MTNPLQSEKSLCQIRTLHVFAISNHIEASLTIQIARQQDCSQSTDLEQQVGPFVKQGFTKKPWKVMLDSQYVVVSLFAPLLTYIHALQHMIRI